MMKRLPVFALLAFTAVGVSSCAWLRARDDLNKGVRAFRDAKYEAAIGFFKEATELDPKLTNAEVYLATAYSQQYIPGAQSEDNKKMAQMAIDTFQQVLQKEAGNVSAVAGLAYIYQNDGQTEKARDAYLRYSQLEPQNPVPHYAVGTMNWAIVANMAGTQTMDEKLKLIEEGLQQLDTALQLNPDYEEAMSYKNLLYRQKATLVEAEDEKKQWESEADKWFQMSIETRKKNAEKKANQPNGIDPNK